MSRKRFAETAHLIALGIVLIVTSSERGSLRSGSLTGDLFVIAAMFVALAWILINQRLMRRGHSPMPVTTWGLLVGTAMLAVWVLAQDGLPPVHGVSLKVWAAVLASGLLCTAASTALWNWASTTRRRRGRECF